MSSSCGKGEAPPLGGAIRQGEGDITCTNAWEAVRPFLTNQEGQRSPESYIEVIGQFDVENNPRYCPRNGCTFCNIFVWDVTLAMNSEIPHWVDIISGAPRQYPDVQGAYETDANGNALWLNNYGEEFGWKKVSAEEAQQAAGRGQPTVVALSNPGGIGHIAVVRPCENQEQVYVDSKGVYKNLYITQAGSSNFALKELAWGFYAASMPYLEFFTHE